MRVHKDTPPLTPLYPPQASQQLAAAGSVSSLLDLYSSLFPPSSAPQDTARPHAASQAVLPGL